MVMLDEDSALDSGPVLGQMLYGPLLVKSLGGKGDLHLCCISHKGNHDPEQVS